MLFLVETGYSCMSNDKYSVISHYTYHEDLDEALDLAKNPKIYNDITITETKVFAIDGIKSDLFYIKNFETNEEKIV